MGEILVRFLLFFCGSKICNCVTLASVPVTSCGRLLPVGNGMVIREKSVEL